jgi:hypothetical protein
LLFDFIYGKSKYEIEFKINGGWVGSTRWNGQNELKSKMVNKEFVDRKNIQLQPIYFPNWNIIDTV